MKWPAGEMRIALGGGGGEGGSDTVGKLHGGFFNFLAVRKNPGSCHAAIGAGQFLPCKGDRAVHVFQGVAQVVLQPHEVAENGFNRYFHEALIVSRAHQQANYHERQKGHSSRRRLGQSFVSHDTRRMQTVVASLRQADGLLPALHANASGHSRHPADFHARRRTALPAGCLALASSGGLPLTMSFKSTRVVWPRHSCWERRS